MDNIEIAKQLLAYHKTAFDNTFRSVSALQEQTEKMMGNFLQQASWLPSETKEAITQWLDAYKKGREEFKKTADQNYEKVTQYFSKEEVASKPKAKKAK
jgi:hypothetical protein